MFAFVIVLAFALSVSSSEVLPQASPENIESIQVPPELHQPSRLHRSVFVATRQFGS